jgi:hypothetical protein
MMHWSDKYIGKPYIKGEYDCICLVSEVYLNEFGKQIDLPQEKGINNIGYQKAILNNKERLAYKISKPEEGCIVLMIGKGRLNHIGIYYLHENIDWVLHNSENVGHVVRTKFRLLSLVGYQVEGLYKWN